MIWLWKIKDNWGNYDNSEIYYTCPKVAFQHVSEYYDEVEEWELRAVTPEFEKYAGETGNVNYALEIYSLKGCSE